MVQLRPCWMPWLDSKHSPKFPFQSQEFAHGYRRHVTLMRSKNLKSPILNTMCPKISQCYDDERAVAHWTTRWPKGRQKVKIRALREKQSHVIQIFLPGCDHCYVFSLYTYRHSSILFSTALAACRLPLQASVQKNNPFNQRKWRLV